MEVELHQLVLSVTYKGVMIDSDMNMKTHVNTTNWSAYLQLNM